MPSMAVSCAFGTRRVEMGGQPGERVEHGWNTLEIGEDCGAGLEHESSNLSNHCKSGLL